MIKHIETYTTGSVERKFEVYHNGLIDFGTELPNYRQHLLRQLEIVDQLFEGNEKNITFFEKIY